MERIIIQEVDNTSNIEALSSYDIVYVPGFANGPNGVINDSLYRTPTLIRDKYEFIRLYGSSVPKFTTPQPYPTEFPDVAKKWGDETGVYYKISTNNFADVADIVDSTFYTQVSGLPFNPDTTYNYFGAELTTQDSTSVYVLSSISAADYAAINNTYATLVPTEVTEEQAEGTIYYKRTGSAGSYVYTQQAETPSTFTNIYTLIATEIDDVFSVTTKTDLYIVGGTEELIIYTQVSSELAAKIPEVLLRSSVNPVQNGWYELDGSEYEITADTAIDPSKTYYGHDEGVNYMFQGVIKENEGTDAEVITYNGDADPGYRYAYALLSMGVPVYYEQMNSSEHEISVSNMYAGLIARFVGSPDDPDPTFDSVGDYSVKFITSGGYPTFEYGSATGTGSLVAAMIAMAAKREDSIALIDHTDNPERALQGDDSVIEAVRNAGMGGDEEAKYAAMFTPWYECSAPGITVAPDGDTSFNNNMMPGSLAYLTALATQIKNYNPWLAVAGVSRGLVPYCSALHTNKPLTNNIADSYQALPGLEQGIAISINPITYIRNYGYCIWGNRTLRNNSAGTKASSFLNIRSAVSDIKKRLYEASQQLLFEQNTDVLWLNFQSLVTPLLETMVNDYILADYSITRLFTDPQTGYAVPAYEVMAAIRIQPINSVEVFDLTVYLENTDEFNITTSETEIG